MKKRHAQADSIITTSLEDNINQILSKLDQMPDLTVQRFSWNQGEEAAILYIEEPYLEPTIKGTHDGFVENASKNLGLLRRYIPSPELKLRQLKIGERGKVTITMAYLEDVANPKVIEELERRIQALSLDVIINIGELQQLISKNTFTVFPQFLVTERPDTTAMQILKGRVAILMDRSPGVLIAPMDLVGFLETKDDYNVNWLLASFVRLLRYIAFMISLVLPAFYVATISFHFEVIPLKLLLSIGESREKVPFPPVLEALVMELSLEMLREAGLRLPGPIGQTVSIVGKHCNWSGCSSGWYRKQHYGDCGIHYSNCFLYHSLLRYVVNHSFTSLSHDDACLFLWLCRNYHGFNDHVYPPYYLTSIGTPYGSPFAPVRMKEWKDAVVLTAPRYLTARPHSASPLQEKKKKATDPTDR